MLSLEWLSGSWYNYRYDTGLLTAVWRLAKLTADGREKLIKDIIKYYENVAGKKIYFLGAGLSHEELIKKHAERGALVTLCDARSEGQLEDYLHRLGNIKLKTSLGEHYLDEIMNADIIYRTPGIDYTKPEIQRAVSAGITVTSEMEMFFSFCPCRIIGVTGSDGKTTTSTLIARVLEAAGYTVHLGGNIGRPLFPITENIKKDDIAVVELSSFQLISMKQSPQIAVVTNITPNHLDHHKDMKEYTDAKRNILLYQLPAWSAVLNIENEVTGAMRGDIKGKLLEFGRRPLSDGAFIEHDTLYAAKQGSISKVMNLNRLLLRGEHNKDNIAAAYCAVSQLVPDEIFAGAVLSFTGVEHRIEFVREINGVSWYNDSIATSPARTRAGLYSFEQKVILIAGGSDKGLEYESVAEDIIKRVKLLYLSGPTADTIRKAVERAGGGVETVMTQNITESVASAAADAVKGDVVILSPASPSFDAYGNFEERGKHFKQLVNAL